MIVGFRSASGRARPTGSSAVARPVLDLMQTMPAFVYLIPAILFFGLGVVPGVIATIDLRDAARRPA